MNIQKTILIIACIKLTFIAFIPSAALGHYGVTLAHYGTETTHEGFHYSESEKQFHSHTCSELYDTGNETIDLNQRTLCEGRRTIKHIQYLLDKYDFKLEGLVDDYYYRLYNVLDRYDDWLWVFILFSLVNFLLLFGFVGGIIGARSGYIWQGFFLGLIFGPLGWCFMLSKRKMMNCPCCKEMILTKATICRFCHSRISQNVEQG